MSPCCLALGPMALPCYRQHLLLRLARSTLVPRGAWPPCLAPRFTFNHACLPPVVRPACLVTVTYSVTVNLTPSNVIPSMPDKNSLLVTRLTA